MPWLFSAQAAAADITTGLVGWWKMDEGSGTSAVDSSGNGNTGTLAASPATPTWTSSSKIGPYALSFDGSNDTVSMGDVNALDGLSKLTISSWFKAIGLPTNYNHASIINKESTSASLFYGWGYQINMENGSGMRRPKEIFSILQ